MRGDSSCTIRCFVIAILVFLSFKGMAQMPEYLNANKTPELKPYDYSAEYDGLKGPVKEVTSYIGRINSVFGNKTLVKDRSVGRVKYLPNGLRMEAHEGEDYGTQHGVKYYLNDSRIDSIHIYDYDEFEGYEKKPNAKIRFEYVSPDSTIEKYYEFKEVSYGKKDWEQTKQLNIKILSGGFECIYFPSVIDKGKISTYVHHGLNFNLQDERSEPQNHPVFF